MPRFSVVVQLARTRSRPGACMGTVFGLVTTRQLERQLEAVMSHIDDVLHEIADKLDHGIDTVLDQVKHLEAEVAKGKVAPGTVDRLRQAAQRLHATVDEEVYDTGHPAGGAAGDEDGTFTDLDDDEAEDEDDRLDQHHENS